MENITGHNYLQFCWCRKFAPALLLLFSSGGMAKDNLSFSGALVTEPCLIMPGDENVQLDFGTVNDKYFYLNQRTRGEAFNVILTDCDPTVAATVRITFNGTENTHLPGLLAIDAASKGSGIAIGFETPEGKPLPLNMQGGKRGLNIGSNRIPLKAYLQGEPQAIAKQTIKFGPFSAVATFSLEYE